MKINDATLQHILKSYGKQIRPDNTRSKLQKEDITKKDNVEEKINSEELDIVNYDQDGRVKVNPQKKDALIDFFE